jgi:predicted ribonuclease YlaK
MAIKKNSNGNVTMNRGNTKRRKPINHDLMTKISPLTENQEKVFKAWDEGKHLFIYGCAGTGKTFIALYKALQACLGNVPSYDQVYLVRSLVPSREIGFLPGTSDDKADVYQIPYKHMVKYMFELTNDDAFDMLYDNLKGQGTIKFWSTSFIRGVTLDNSVVIVDEFQNLSGHELDSIVTRVGENTRIIFCGDVMQSDLIREREKNGIYEFMRIIERMPDDFAMVEMGIDDICRSGLLRNYLVTKMGLNIRFT